MQPEIKILAPKKLVGIRMKMSFADNKTFMLWNQFMPRREEIQHAIGKELYSIQEYATDFFTSFDPAKSFDRYAAVEVAALGTIPSGMELIALPAGMYAVFEYKGDARNAASVFQYILGTWLPASGYVLDVRPHFEVLGEKYKKDDPESEEEIWIPVRRTN